MEKITIAVFFNRSGALVFQTWNSENPIIIYNKVQTGGNTQLGGFQEGLLSCAYQPGISLTEKKPPLKPGMTVIASDRTNLIGLFINIKLILSRSF